MKNKAMERVLSSGEVVDICKLGENQGAGRFRLADDFVATADTDYCDAERDVWIWSIGKHRKTGAIVASTSVEFYRHPDYECLWLR